MDDDPFNIDSSEQHVYRQPARRVVDTSAGRTNRQPIRPERRRQTDTLIQRFVEPDRRSTGNLRNPLVRRAPYRYEDDPLAQEQFDAPAVRRSPRGVRYENEQVHYQVAPPSRSQSSPDILPAKPRRTSNVQEKGGSQLQLINHYRRNVLQQAHQSFILALVAAAIGLIFYIAAVSFLVLRQPASISVTSLISGSLVELISAINFYLYGRASRQLASFHMYLDRTCRFLASDEACEKITDQEKRDKTRSQLIMAFMNMPQTVFDASETKNPSINEDEGAYTEM